MSMQCAVAALIRTGDKLPPYKGNIEADCANSVKHYTSNFYQELKTFLECKKIPSAEISCSFKIFKARHYEDLIMVEFIGAKLYNEKKLEPQWIKSLKKVSYQLDQIDQDAAIKCKSEMMSGLDYSNRLSVDD